TGAATFSQPGGEASAGDPERIIDQGSGPFPDHAGQAWPRLRIAGQTDRRMDIEMDPVMGDTETKRPDDRTNLGVDSGQAMNSLGEIDRFTECTAGRVGAGDVDCWEFPESTPKSARTALDDQDAASTRHECAGLGHCARWRLDRPDG